MTAVDSQQPASDEPAVGGFVADVMLARGESIACQTPACTRLSLVGMCRDCPACRDLPAPPPALCWPCWDRWHRGHTRQPQLDLPAG